MPVAFTARLVGADRSPGVKVGSRSVIGAGSVVTRDIPEDGMKRGGLPPCRSSYTRLKNATGAFKGSGQGPRLWETAMLQTIVWTVDYHDQNCVLRRLTAKTAEEQVLSVPTLASELSRVVAQARAEVGRRGRVLWIQESTTGGARVQALLGDEVEFLLANVVQMPLPPKARRRKTDKIDTARMQREYLNGSLPLAHQPPPWWRQTRRLVAHRESLVARQTSLRNWINRYLAHETWEERGNRWSGKGRRRLQAIVATLPARDALVVTAKRDELDQLQQSLAVVLAELLQVYKECPDAQRVDAVRGIG
jgi:hypothetical protein